MEKQKRIKEKIIQILDKYLGGNYVLFAFGYYVNGDAVKSSDIDLAVYKNKRIPSSAILYAKEAIEKASLIFNNNLCQLRNKKI